MCVCVCHKSIYEAFKQKLRIWILKQERGSALSVRARARALSTSVRVLAKVDWKITLYGSLFLLSFLFLFWRYIFRPPVVSLVPSRASLFILLPRPSHRRGYFTMWLRRADRKILKFKRGSNRKGDATPSTYVLLAIVHVSCNTPFRLLWEVTRE